MRSVVYLPKRPSYIAAVVCALYSLISTPASAENSGILDPVQTMPMAGQCGFVESYFARETFGEGTNCQSNSPALALSFEVSADGGRVTLTRPNGTRVRGVSVTAEKYDGIPYTIMVASDGIGSSTLTLFPNNDAIWTGHFTLQKNTAYSHFGACEVTY